MISIGNYSENIQKPKMEHQNMHFSKESFTLHCTVVHNSSDVEDNVYVYHFSDISKHNWCQAKCVEIDIEQNFFHNQSIIWKKTL